jgi:hypothetical protein
MSPTGRINIELAFLTQPLMASRISLLKMEKSAKIEKGLIFYILILVLLISPVSSIAKSPDPSKKSPLEEEVLKALSKSIECKKMEVLIVSAKGKADLLKTLTVKCDDINLGQTVADTMTLVYEDPVIDVVTLRRSKELHISSYSRSKVSMLISVGGLEKYFSNKAKQFGKRYNRISIKFSPPYIECFFDVPAQEISPETLKLLDRFVKGGKLEGYAAFQLKVKDNALYALSSKVIVNHFLVPELILRELQRQFNPFDGFPIIKPFPYSINHATVQNKYIYLTN